jgi:hypothetical protein
MKELRPELIATHQGDVRVFEGHAFVVEAAVGLGVRDIRAGINVYRFANRIPLLFEGGSDVGPVALAATSIACLLAAAAWACSRTWRRCVGMAELGDAAPVARALLAVGHWWRWRCCLPCLSMRAARCSGL